jgi:hypothetical protein
MNFNNDLFKARIYHGLKSIFTPGDTLPPRLLEFAVCESFGVKHTGDSKDFADGFCNDIQLSVKTRQLTPHVLKTKIGRDFQTNPAMFLGPHQNVKQNKWTAGIEIVQRRQQLDFKNDSTEPAKKNGVATLKGFQDNIEESYKKYKTSVSYEVIVVHGYNRNNSSYIVSVFWQEYVPVDASKISWTREGVCVAGYVEIDGVLQKVCERINGNAKRESTCFKEYKNLTKYNCSASISLPLPDPWEFDKDNILTEINLKEKLHEIPILFTE